MSGSYRSFVYHEDCRKGKIIELPSKDDLQKWFIDNPGWVHTPADLPTAIAAIVDTPPTAPKEEKLTIERSVKDQVELLLKGLEVNGKLGFSLRSFGAIYGIPKSYIGKLNAKRPVYEAILKAYQDKKLIWCHNGSRWFLKGVNPYKKKKNKGNNK